MPRWMLYSVISMLAWAAWSLLAPLASSGLSGAMVQMISSLGLLPVAIGLWLIPNRRPHVHLGKGLVLATSTGLLAGSGNILLYLALETGGPMSVVFPVTSLAPAVPVLAAPFLFHERISWLQGGAIAVALVAILLLNTSPSGETVALTAATFVSKWMLYSIASLVVFGITYLPQKAATYFISDELSTVAFTGGFFLLDAMLLITDRTLTWNIPPRAGAASLVIGVLMGLGSLTLFQAYRHGKASIVTPFVQLFTVISVVLGIPLYGDVLDWRRGIGIVLAIGAGVVLSLEQELPVNGSATTTASTEAGNANREK